MFTHRHDERERARLFMKARPLMHVGRVSTAASLSAPMAQVVSLCQHIYLFVLTVCACIVCVPVCVRVRTVTDKTPPASLLFLRRWTTTRLALLINSESTLWYEQRIQSFSKGLARAWPPLCKLRSVRVCRETQGLDKARGRKGEKISFESSDDPIHSPL